MNKAYELLKEERLYDIDSMGFIFEHKKSRARISIISNDDDNKVFYIGFRTPPKDSTGVAHIIEHTVLCGSDKYPVKDPFVELVKGSLNTFLNAMTYPDKTMYPVASTNDADFRNLMDVYMDAVFHPNIYKLREIFEQEGWHYELENRDSDITINGVVYNEMKGAFSSPEDVLSREIMTSLFPDNTYFYESGGDPKVIPELTYEDYLEFHRKYYHPSNSFIYIYGDVNIDEVLRYLDKEYLCEYDELFVDSEIPLQKAFDEPVDITKEYSVSSTADTDDSAYLSLNYVVGDALDQRLYQAFDILEYALVSSPGAPIHKALIDAGIGEDILGSFDTSTRQPMFSVVAKGANERDKERFVEIIVDTLKKQVKNGIDKKALLAAINTNQFRVRESDFGHIPKGLMFGIQMMDSWLYDKNLPFLHLHGIEVLDELKKRVDTDYFEKLVEKYLLDNNHRSTVMLVPKQGLTTREDEALKEKLAKYKATLSNEQLDAIIERTAHLKAYQAEPSPKEDLAKIPMLTRGDLKIAARPIDLEVHDEGANTILHHKVNTNGIHYYNMVFDISDIDMKSLPYASMLERFLGMVDTSSYTYTDFSNEMALHTGGYNPTLSIHSINGKRNEYRIVFEIRTKFIMEEAAKAMELVEEMIFTSNFHDEKRLKELIAQDKSRLEMIFSSAGHQVASNTARSGFSKRARIAEITSGVEYYKFICDLDEHFDERKAEVSERLTELSKMIFVRERLMISTTGKIEAFVQAKTLLNDIIPKLHKKEPFPVDEPFREKLVKKGYKDAAQIQYVCRAGNFNKAGFEYTGAYKVLTNILGNDYFWINVRVQGGAYGCMCSFNREGDVHFVSYRDPNLEKTNEIFEATPEYIRNFEADEREMTKNIIGTISNMDTPLTPSQRGLRGLSAYLSEIPFEQLQAEREQVINCTVEDIRALAEPVAEILKQGYFAVVGNEDHIEENKELFIDIEDLL